MNKDRFLIYGKIIKIVHISLLLAMIPVGIYWPNFSFMDIPKIDKKHKTDSGHFQDAKSFDTMSKTYNGKVMVEHQIINNE